jgi:hypothetical protein
MLVSQSGTSFELTMLAEARAEVAIADQKASQLLAALIIGYGAVCGGLVAAEWSPAHMTASGEALWWAGAVAAVLSIVLAAVAVWPRFRSNEPTAGIAYWAQVARFPTLEALSAAMDGQPEDAPDRTRHQLWRISRLVRRKYYFVRAAIIATGAGLVFFGMATLSQ